MEPSQHRPLDGDLAVFDPAASLNQIGGDADLLEVLIAAHLEQEPRLLRTLEEVISKGDAPAIRKAAHALASSVSVLCATRARAAAKHLEGLGLRGELAGIEEAHRQMKDEFCQLRDVLRDNRRSRAA